MDVVRWSEQPAERMGKGVIRQAVHMEGLTVARFMLAKGATVALHDHVNEQVCTMLAGSMLFELDGARLALRAGESVVIPAGATHGVPEVLEDTVILDVFAPRRDDWLAGDDHYLR
ncbi:MAG: cupin domain-containing protein [Gaiella sp.]